MTARRLYKPEGILDKNVNISDAIHALTQFRLAVFFEDKAGVAAYLARLCKLCGKKSSANSETDAVQDTRMMRWLLYTVESNHLQGDINLSLARTVLI